LYKLNKVLLLLLLMSSSYLYADALYKWTDDNGYTHYSDEPPEKLNESTETLTLLPLNSLESAHIKNSTAAFADNAVDDASIPGNSSLESSSSEQGSLQARSKNRYMDPKKCQGLSPRSTSDTLVREQLSNSEHKMIDNLFQGMKGDWRGKAIFSTCRGTDEEPSVEFSEYAVELDITLRRSKELTLAFDMYSSELGKTRKEEIALFLSKDHISYSTNLSDQTILMGVTNNTFVLWVSQFAVQGVQKELVRSFNIENKVMEIEQYVYINGILSGLVVWELYKRF
jgi:uncharacterized protein DUF4124